MPLFVPSVRRTVRTWRELVIKADPDFERDKRNELEYEFSNGKQFRGNRSLRGAYTPS